MANNCYLALSIAVHLKRKTISYLLRQKLPETLTGIVLKNITTSSTAKGYNKYFASFTAIKPSII